MTSPLEFEGTDVDEAITAACKQLDATREQLQVKVLATGFSGIFGLLRRKARIRVRRKEQQTEEIPAPPAEEQTDNAPPPDAAAEKSSGRGAGLSVQTKEAVSRPQSVPVPAEFHGLLRDELMTLLSLMKMEGEVTIDEQQGKTRFHIHGPCVAQLTDRGGQALDGLQYLLGKITGKQLPEGARFIVDAEDYRQKRRQELQELALQLAEEVKEKKGNRTIPPLSPAERRIVHMTLQEDRAIRSRSVGSGLFKKVLIYKPGAPRPRKKRRRGSMQKAR